MKQLRRWTTILGLALLAFTAFAVTAEAQARTTRPRGDRYERPDYDRNDRGYERNRGDNRAYSLARELEDAARHAADVADRRTRRDDRGITESFFRFEEAARQFSRAADRNGNAGRGEFDRVAARYYELRGAFSRYHGPQDVRAAFHRINRPMEELYRMYTGRDLYRDDPNRGGNARYGQQRGYDRYDDDRWDRDDRGNRGARDTRTVIRRRN